MSEAAFPAHIEAALNSFTVPALPSGFADRLIERVELREEIVTLPPRSRSHAGPWRRAGRMVLSLGAIGFVTAAAAAGGIFGKPVYVPVLTEAMEQASIIEPREKPPAVVAQHKPAAAPVAAPAPAEPVVGGKEKAKAALDTLQQKPEYQALRPFQKARAAMRETQALVKSGEVSKEEARAALRETNRANFEKLTPRQKAIYLRQRKAMQERREARREARRDRMQQAQPQTAPIQAPPE